MDQRRSPAVNYCKGWFRARKRPSIDRYTDAQARERHDAGELYCALIGAAERPVCFLEICRGFVGVGFLDEQLREVLSYSFQEKAPGRLFLAMATWREFDGASDTVREGTTHVFDVNGSVAIRRETLVPAYELATAAGHVDIAGHWDDFPQFGRYERLIRPER